MTLPCHRCGRQPHISEPKLALDTTYVDVYCLECYDGATDAGPQLVGFGWSRELAIADWEEITADAAEEASYG